MNTWAKIAIGIGAALLAIAAVLWVFHNIFFPNWTPSWEQTPSTKTETFNTTGQWSLGLKTDTTLTQSTGSLHSMGTGKIDFSIPEKGGKFTAVGPWTSDGTGAVGPSSETSKIEGQISIEGEVINGKLHFTSRYISEKCLTTINTPIGNTTSTDCGTASPEVHMADIEIADGKTATVNSDENGNGYTLTWREVWTLNKSQ